MVFNIKQYSCHYWKYSFSVCNFVVRIGYTFAAERTYFAIFVHVVS